MCEICVYVFVIVCVYVCTNMCVCVCVHARTYVNVCVPGANAGNQNMVIRGTEQTEKLIDFTKLTRNMLMSKYYLLIKKMFYALISTKLNSNNNNNNNNNNNKTSLTTNYRQF